jgi:phosphatidate cytidylyltransferase
VTRVLSGAALLAFTVAIVWFAPATVFVIVGEGILLLAFAEYAAIARGSGIAIPETLSALAAALTAASFSRLTFNASWISLDLVLVAALVSIGAVTIARWRGGSDAVALAAVAVFPSLYLGLSLGTMIAVREVEGREALFLVILAVAISDTAQYYTGRTFGRRPLAPAVSPKKTIEGAVGGFVATPIFVAVAGAWWLNDVRVPSRVLLGVLIVAAGIAGDLFESMLKRSAGMKDSSNLIPGHGGILDRIDGLLFAAPVYYIVLKYV